MKNFVVVLLFVILFSLNSKAVDWQKIESGTDKVLFKIGFVDAMNGWIVGEKGLILQTTDGGNSWIDKSEDKEEFNGTLSILPNGTVLIADENGIMLKILPDGSNESIDIGTQRDLISMFFINNELGWAVGEDGIIMKSEDGGDTWSITSEGTPGFHLWNVYFLDEMNGWTVGEMGTVMKTTDGGSNWTKITNCPAIFRNLKVYFINNEIGWVAGYGFLAKTTNGGNSWETQIKTTIFAVGDIQMLDSLNGWASFDFKYILHTTDGGENWNYIDAPINFVINQLSYNDGRMILIGEGGLIYKADMNVSVKNEHDLSDKFEICADANSLILRTETDYIEGIEISLYSLLGNTILSEYFESSMSLTINLSNYDLPKGAYFVKIKTKDGMALKKVII